MFSLALGGSCRLRAIRLATLGLRTLGLGAALVSVVACSTEAEFAAGDGARYRNDQDAVAADPPPVAAPDVPMVEGPVDEPIETPIETPRDIPIAEPEDVPQPAPSPSPLPRTIEQNFPAARIEGVSLTVDASNRVVTRSFSLRESTPTVTSFTQLERRLAQDGFTQGHDGGIVTPEVFSLVAAGPLDVLVVIDDSSSMGEESLNLSTKLDPLLSSIGNADWRIAVVTTSNPCLRGNRLIKKGDADAASAFASAVITSLEGGVEKGFQSAIRALRGECAGKVTPWLRASAAVAVLLVSDEDNCGSNTGDACPGEEGETVQQMVDFLRNLRPSGDAKIYGLFEGPGNPCVAAYEAIKYRQAVEATGGTWGSICESDYTATLRTISSNISNIITRKVELSHVPDAGSLEISIDGRVLTSGYTLNGKILTLSDVRAGETTLTATYRFGAVPKVTTLTLSEAPDTTTLAVTIDGRSLASQGFSYQAATRTVRFVEAPADSARVIASYRPASIALPTYVSLSSSDIIGSPLSVTVNGAVSSQARYDAATKRVSFTTPPPDGARIDVRHRTAGGRITAYPMPLDYADDFVAARDATTGAEVSAAVNANGVTVAPAEVVDGRVITLYFDVARSPEELTVELGTVPLQDSLRIANKKGQALCGNDAPLVGTSVSLDCAAGQGQVTVSYDRLVERYSSFTVPGDFDAEKANWQVFVDGEETLDFTRVERTIAVPMALLAMRSTVKVVVNLNFKK